MEQSNFEKKWQEFKEENCGSNYILTQDQLYAFKAGYLAGMDFVADITVKAMDDIREVKNGKE